MLAILDSSVQSVLAGISHRDGTIGLVTFPTASFACALSAGIFAVLSPLLDPSKTCSVTFVSLMASWSGLRFVCFFVFFRFCLLFFPLFFCLFFKEKRTIKVFEYIMLLECILVKTAAECSITVDEDAIMFGYIMSLGCVKIATVCGVSQ